jgi:hypothetical protein
VLSDFCVFVYCLAFVVLLNLFMGLSGGGM